MIAKFEDRLARPPLTLPPHVNLREINDFDHRRVYASGYLRHDQEMLVGPRVRDGKSGFNVVTPLERDGTESTVLINRGWIAKDFRCQNDRSDGLPAHRVVIEGLLRSPFKKNVFTPDNKPEIGEYYFPDVEQMALLTDSQPVWIEEVMGTSTSATRPKV